MNNWLRRAWRMKMTNDEIRQVLRYACHNGNIERYKLPLIKEDIKAAFTWFIIGGCAGFIFGFILRGMI